MPHGLANAADGGKNILVLEKNQPRLPPHEPELGAKSGLRELRSSLYLNVRTVGTLIASLLLIEILLKLQRLSESVVLTKNRFEIRQNDYVDLIENDNHYGWVNSRNKSQSVDYKLIAMGMKYTWTFSNDPDRNRITNHCGNNISFEKKQKINTYGCSFTYGIGLNDNSSYPYKLQQLLDNYDILNCGVGSYSTYQCLLKIRDDLRNIKPKFIVLGIIYAHERRNTGSFLRKLETRGLRSPYCLSKGNKLHEYKASSWIKVLFSEKLSMVAMLEQGINYITSIGRNSFDIQMKTMEHVLLKIRKECNDNDCSLIVAILDGTKKYHNFLYKNNFNWCAPEFHGADTLFPFDDHPNDAATDRFAQEIYHAIHNVLHCGKSSPDFITIAQYLKTTKNNNNEVGGYVYPIH